MIVLDDGNDRAVVAVTVEASSEQKAALGTRYNNSLVWSVELMTDLYMNSYYSLLCIFIHRSICAHNNGMQPGYRRGHSFQMQAATARTVDVGMATAKQRFALLQQKQRTSYQCHQLTNVMFAVAVL